MDKNGNGELDKEELEECLRRVGIPVNDDILQALMEKHDTSGNLQLDLGEFRNLFIEYIVFNLINVDVCKKQMIEEFARIDVN